MNSIDQIDPSLFGKIKKQLGKGRTVTYDRISAVANEHNVPMWVAAVKLASSLGIGVKKYATQDYFSYFRSGQPTTTQVVVQPTRPQRQRQVLERPRLLVFDLQMVADPELRAILLRDVKELNSAIAAGYENTSKTCMILAGSIAEALILERLTRDSSIEAEAISLARVLTKEKPSKPTDLKSWSLATLVEVAVTLKKPLLPGDSIAQIGQLRHWRNLVHPGRELKSMANERVSPTAQRAQNAVGFLEFIRHELK